MTRIMKGLLKTLIIFLLLLIIAYMIAYISGNPDDNSQRYIKLYDDTDNIYYQSIEDYSGHYVTLDEVSSYFKDAIVSIEDQRFYQHHGFDYIGIVRALKTNLLNQKNAQGASTITQQYARLLYLTNEKTYSRKIKEAFYTMQLETHLTKSQILEGYINHVYFGHGIYGIENASQYFFQKSARNLTLNEASLLAGVVNGPQYYSPCNNLKRSKERQKLVLNAMKRNGYIDQSQIESVQHETLQLSKTHDIQENMSTYYYRDAVIEELDELGFYTNQYLNKGLNVYTSFHQTYQDEINELIKSQAHSSSLQCAFMVSQPKTGAIQAMIGGMNYSSSQFNRATKAKRQIGSTVKPLLYYLALENGFQPNTQFMSQPTTFQLENKTTYTPKNYNNKYAYKDITLAQAIAVSDNIYAVKTHLFLGSHTLYQFLNDHSIDCKDTASLSLGTVNTNIYNLSSIYSGLANYGKTQKLYTIEKIVDNEGHIIYQHKKSSVQEFNKESCLVLSQLLQGTFNNQFSTYLSATMANYPIDIPLACKTGSTDYDNLLVAYNPDVLLTAWSGCDNNQKIEESDDKIFVKKVSQSFLNNQNDLKSWYKPTKHLLSIAINPLTGENDESGIVYWFKQE